MNELLNELKNSIALLKSMGTAGRRKLEVLVYTAKVCAELDRYLLQCRSLQLQLTVPLQFDPSKAVEVSSESLATSSEFKTEMSFGKLFRLSSDELYSDVLASSQVVVHSLKDHDYHIVQSEMLCLASLHDSKLMSEVSRHCAERAHVIISQHVDHLLESLERMVLRISVASFKIDPKTALPLFRELQSTAKHLTGTKLLCIELKISIDKLAAKVPELLEAFKSRLLTVMQYVEGSINMFRFFEAESMMECITAFCICLKSASSVLPADLIQRAENLRHNFHEHLDASISRFASVSWDNYESSVSETCHLTFMDALSRLGQFVDSLNTKTFSNFDYLGQYKRLTSNVELAVRARLELLNIRDVSPKNVTEIHQCIDTIKRKLTYLRLPQASKHLVDSLLNQTSQRMDNAKAADAEVETRSMSSSSSTPSERTTFSLETLLPKLNVLQLGLWKESFGETEVLNAVQLVAQSSSVTPEIDILEMKIELLLLRESMNKKTITSAKVPTAVAEEPKDSSRTQATDTGGDGSNDDNKVDQSIDLCFILDISGSMSLFLSRCKQEIRHMIDQAIVVVSSSQLYTAVRVNILTYRGENEAVGYWQSQSLVDLSVHHNDTHQVLLSSLYDYLDSLQARSGSNTQENILSAFTIATNKLNWGTGQRLLAWFGDTTLNMIPADENEVQVSGGWLDNPNSEGLSMKIIIQSIHDCNIKLLVYSLNEDLTNPMYQAMLKHLRVGQVDQFLLYQEASVVYNPTGYHFVLCIPDGANTPWATVCKAYESFIYGRLDNQGLGDRITVIQYDDSARVTLPMESVDSISIFLSQSGGGNSQQTACERICQVINDSTQTDIRDNRLETIVIMLEYGANLDVEPDFSSLVDAYKRTPFGFYLLSLTGNEQTHTLNSQIKLSQAKEVLQSLHGVLIQSSADPRKCQQSIESLCQHLSPTPKCTLAFRDSFNLTPVQRLHEWTNISKQE